MWLWHCRSTFMWQGPIGCWRGCQAFEWIIERALDMKLHTWMPKRDGRSIMINQRWVTWRWFSPNSIGQTRTGITSIVNTVSVFVSHVIGISMVATALILDFRYVAVTEKGSSRGQYLRLGRLEAIKSACTLLTRDTEQQLSNGKGKCWPADVTEAHRMLRCCNWASGIAELGGIVTTGNPNKGVDNDDWSEATGGNTLTNPRLYYRYFNNLNFMQVYRASNPFWLGFCSVLIDKKRTTKVWKTWN